MATRKAKTTNYFTHDSNARNDERIVRLRMKHGAEGYGVFFMLLERMREETDYMSVKDYNMIAFDLRVDAAIVESVVEDFGLFVFTEDGKYFYSESFTQRMELKDSIRKQRSEIGKKGNMERWGAAQAMQTPAKQTNETNLPTTKQIASNATALQTDNKAFLSRFFDKTNNRNIEVLLMNFGLKPADRKKLIKAAKEIVAEWEITKKDHSNYTDWSQHLIATMRIKIMCEKKGAGGNATKQDSPPTNADHEFNGGFGGKDI